MIKVIVDAGTPLENKILNRINKNLFLKNEKNKCWIWQGTHLSDGYAGLWYKNKMRRVNRLIYTWFFGIYPHKLFVCHKCDNPLCVNPYHLFLGTNSDNLKDMRNKGRESHFGSKGMNFGENNGKSTILKEYQVIKILKDNHSQHTIAKKYNVSRSCIASIKQRKNWRYIKWSK